MVNRIELREKLKDGKPLKVIEKFLDDEGIEHDGAFGETPLKVVFIKTRKTRETADKIEKAIGFGLAELLRGACGVLTDKGVFEDEGSGWIYLRWDLI